ncbi:MAG: putative DNA-binding protein [Epulopiscium sp.]|nr:putative DNA-binding protein [Candidatus Epulonipiscium sp.]
MEHILEITLLYDFYGGLLTDKQKDIFELYYHDDLSLAEIAEQFSISRQGVYDTLKRCETLLFQYENAIQLVKRFIKSNNSIKKMIDKMEEIEKNLEYPDKILMQIKDMKDMAYKILNG